MKKIFILTLLVCIYSIGISQHKQQQLKDGMYIVDQVLYDTHASAPSRNQATVLFSHDFAENAPPGSTGLLVNTEDFVPLELEEDPHLIQQTENKKKLELTFSRMTSQKLERFTARHVMKQATLIVNGEALTMDKIREAIHGGKLEITGCSDKACERLYVTLKKNVTGNKN